MGDDRIRNDEIEPDGLIALIPHMRAFAQSLCRDPTQAEDLTQDALASAWEHRSTYSPGTNLKAWVFTILRNRFYSEKRRSWRALPLDQNEAEKTLFAVSNPQAVLDLDDVRHAMLQLCDEQREALILIAVAGLPYRDAAMICGCAEGTMKSRVSRARQRLLELVSHGDRADRSRVEGSAMESIVADAERLSARGAGRRVEAPEVRARRSGFALTRYRSQTPPSARELRGPAPTFASGLA